MTAHVDEDLLKPRKVTACTADKKMGFGFDVTLECGHECWCAVEPGPIIVTEWNPERQYISEVPMLYCAECLDRVLAQVRGQQKERVPDED